jgi:hypothetical protein
MSHTEQPTQTIPAHTISDKSLAVCSTALDKLEAYLETILRYAIVASKAQTGGPVVQAAIADRDAVRRAKSEIQAEWRLRHPEDGDY